MSSKVLCRMIAGFFLIGIGAAQAQQKAEESKLLPGSFTVGFALTNEYLFRGLSQTDQGPAIQGSIEYAQTFTPSVTGYVGVWASNVDFDDGDEANIEIDFTGGLRGEVSGITWNLGGIGYVYPGAASRLNYDYAEAVAKLGYDFKLFAVTGGVNYAPNYFGNSGDGIYVSGDVSVPLPFLPLEAALAGHVGHQSMTRNGNFGTPDYLDWNIGASIKVEGFTLALQYSDTDIAKGQCFAGRDWCEGRAIFTVSRSF